jgi:nicotine blue oxidoreductase
LTTAAVVLAAGAGTRFGGSKLRAPFRDRPLLSWAIDAALGAGLDEVVVVTGGHDLADLLPAEVIELPNPRWDEGQASSLQVAVAHAETAGHEAIVVGLGDSPLVGADAWRAVAEADSPIATATFGGERRPPVRLDQEVWGLLPDSGDEGARVLLTSRPDLVVEVPCPGDPRDVDTRGDLSRWS